MFKVSDVNISGFWGKYSASSNFNDGVNIIIGENGTGKTTFMNILQGVLSVDSEALSINEFNSVEITLSNNGRNKKIKVSKVPVQENTFPIVEYKISNKKFNIVIGDEQLPFSLRRRANEQVNSIRQELSKLVSLASLSVYRTSTNLDVEYPEKREKNLASPVDIRLNSLLQRLTHYQLELSNKARSISNRLQTEVLISMLYSKDNYQSAFEFDFNEEEEERSLIQAYKQLGLSGGDIKARIKEHINAISTASKKLQKLMSRSPNDASAILDDNEDIEEGLDFSPLEAKRRTKIIIDKALSAESETAELFSQVDKFIHILKKFIPGKTFTFNEGKLIVQGNQDISIGKLSSGEKQLLILLTEALLQRQLPYIFLADEPELSLHISWQREIINSIILLNPNAQVIVATHSPEIAGKYLDKIIDMDEIRSV